MNTLEIVMVIIGVLLIGASYVLSEKEEKKGPPVGKTVEEVKISVSQFLEDNREVLERHLKQLLDDTYEDWKEDSKEELGRITNEKIMAFQEFSDQILEKIDSNHQEVVFLYDMLTKKENEIKKTVQEVSQVRAKSGIPLNEKISSQKPEQMEQSTVKEADGIRKAQQAAKKKAGQKKSGSMPQEKKPEKDLQSAMLAQKVQAKQGKKPTGEVGENQNDKILSMYRGGKDIVEISKILGKGQGEVKLVIDLFENGK